ncbi:unnamed protein product [Effrenium voratum]|uniref:Uncharacterized protein n=1 Tax=Effrenium voratum TaxID=2562239 RepID=A0AA36IKU6_9DINO|nr:unnamed protein product [Effrenium voratum]CAJ1388583.1 unnamed protein product [Effrenium voratum]CAJ1431612.1 unnamed protein product [Effrenium voratum]
MAASSTTVVKKSSGRFVATVATELEKVKGFIDGAEGTADNHLTNADELCDVPVRARDCISLLGLACAPGIAVLQLGLLYLILAAAESYGLLAVFVFLSLLSLLYSCLVGLAQHKLAADQAAAQAAQAEAGQAERPSLYSRLLGHAQRLKDQADKLHSSEARAEFCKMPWMAALGLLALEFALAAGQGHFLRFLQAAVCFLPAAAASGLLPSKAAGRAPPLSLADASPAERVAAALARGAVVQLALGQAAALLEPLVEEYAPSAEELKELGGSSFQQVRGYVTEVQAVRAAVEKKGQALLKGLGTAEKVLRSDPEELQNAVQEAAVEKLKEVSREKVQDVAQKVKEHLSPQLDQEQVKAAVEVATDALKPDELADLLNQGARAGGLALGLAGKLFGK